MPASRSLSSSYLSSGTAIRSQLNGCTAFTALAWGVWPAAGGANGMFYPFTFCDTTALDWGLYPYDSVTIYVDCNNGSTNNYGARTVGHNMSVAYTVGQIMMSGDPVYVYQCKLAHTGQSPNNSTYWRNLGLATSVFLHFAMVFDGSGANENARLKLYINAVQHEMTWPNMLNGTTSTIVPSAVGTHSINTVEIGRINAGGLRYNKANAAHGPTQVYRKALTQAQIQEHMLREKANFGSQIGYWTMRSPSTTNGAVVELDRCGLGSDLTLNGTGGGTLTIGPRI